MRLDPSSRRPLSPGRQARALLVLGLMCALVLGGLASASAQARAQARVQSLWSSAAPSSGAVDPDQNSVELGTRFKTKVAGTVVGLRYWRTPENRGPHVGTLWSDGGKRRMSVTFSGESSSGWQTARFARPVAVSAGHWYVVSYHAPHGRYFVTGSHRAPSLSPSLAVTLGRSGVYAYGDEPKFPTQVWNGSQYWVDVLFRPSTSPSPTPSSPKPTQSASPTSDPGALSVRVAGNRLVDGAGRAVVLRGVNVSGTEFSCIQGGEASNRGWSIYGGQPLTAASTYAGVASWRANVVRVPLNEDCWLGINGVNPSYGGAAYRRAIHDEVAAIHAAGLYAVLDLHWNAPGRYAAVAQQPMADADHSIDFWKSVAGEFKADPAVVFDLYNEPYLYWIADGTDQWDCWLSGCRMSQFVTAGQTGPNGESTAYTTSVSWRSAGMQQLVDAVRSSGATQPIIVNGVDWSNDLSGWLSHRPKDPAGQLIAGWHSYNGQPCAVASCWNDVIAPLAQSVPVLAGETGDSATGTPTYMPRFLPWADEHGLSYLAWTWNVWGDADNVLVRAWDGSSPTAGEGTYYRDHLRSRR